MASPLRTFYATLIRMGQIVQEMTCCLWKSCDGFQESILRRVPLWSCKPRFLLEIAGRGKMGGGIVSLSFWCGVNLKHEQVKSGSSAQTPTARVYFGQYKTACRETNFEMHQNMVDAADIFRLEELYEFRTSMQLQLLMPTHSLSLTERILQIDVTPGYE